ncbi:MAG: recombination mediator RecR [Bacteroidales bacterium]|nr:recombination mediator RecR [Bacteroidales bacterium]
MHSYPSQLLENGVEQLSKLPGIGKRTALRLAMWLLKQDEQVAIDFAKHVLAMRTEMQYCECCHNLSDKPVCNICESSSRDASLLCVVCDVRDVMAIENTASFKGYYHVLGGVISPIEGVSPRDLNLENLFERLKNEPIQEVLLALPSTMDGETTQFYIHKHISPTGIKLTTIAKGVAIGDELEYTDEVTLGRSIINRVEI